MGKERVKEKIRTLLHPAKVSSDSDSIAPLFKKAPKPPYQTPEVASSQYNGMSSGYTCCSNGIGDQCFGSCCRGRGYAR
ncbi:hypothetical protein BJX99DRAFT_218778 [Aspergillus californicus]